MERVPGQADGVVPRYKVQRPRHNTVVDFYQDGTNDEGPLVVYRARVLARLDEIV